MAHMVSAMNKVLRYCISDITVPFVNDVPIKGCPEDMKDESVGKYRCRKFIVHHITDCDRIKRLEGV